MSAVANRYLWVCSPGGMKVQRRWVPDLSPGAGGRGSRGGSDIGAPGVGRAGRQSTGFTTKASRDMRWVWNALPWDDLANLTLVTLTYPGDWRRWCEDKNAHNKQFRRWRERLRREWNRQVFGPVRGAWAREFQPRPDRPVREQLAPHLHIALELPDPAVLTRDPTDGRIVWDWGREQWFEIVGSNDWSHRYWGVHARPCFYGRFGGGRENAKRIGDYLWRDFGKLAQKEVPPSFEGLKWWDVWGIEPIEETREISEAEAMKLRRPLVLLRDKKTGAKVRRPLRRDGLSVTNVDGLGTGGRLLDWAGRELGLDAHSAQESDR